MEARSTWARALPIGQGLLEVHVAIMDILRQYAERATDTHADFDEVARQAPPEVVGAGIAQAMRSDQSPPFGDMASRLFGNSSPQQRASLLGQLIQSLGPTVLSSIAGGALAKFGQGASPPTTPNVSAEDASRITPEQVRDIANEAARKDPTVMDRVGGFYAQHPDVFKALGGSVLAIAPGQMANRATATATQPQAAVDVEAILSAMAQKNPQKLNWRTSIVDLMKLLDLDSSLGARQSLAKELGYTGDVHDSATMNVWLQKQVMSKLAANGGKVPEDLKH